MSYSGDAAEQVVRMSLEGAEVAAKITGAGAKQVAILLYAILREQKKTKPTPMTRSDEPRLKPTVQATRQPIPMTLLAICLSQRTQTAMKPRPSTTPSMQR